MIKFFLHTQTRVRIVTDENEFECSPARFAELSPNYPGLPAGAIARSWTPGRAYFEPNSIEYDGHDCSPYCDNVATYTLHPVLFADVVLSKEDIRACDDSDSILFTAAIKDGAGNVLPISYDWFVRLTHEEQGDIDRVLLDFVAGQCQKEYRFLQGNPLGTWLVDESKFDLIQFSGQTYQIKLLNPIQFVAYRELVSWQNY